MENSKTLYQRLVENVPVGAYRVADSGELRYANDTLAQIVGYDTAAQLDAAETGIEYTNPRDRESFRERLDTLSAPLRGTISGRSSETVQQQGIHAMPSSSGFRSDRR